MKLHKNVKASISGIRGRYPDELSVEHAVGLILSYVNILPTSSAVVIGRDMRPGSIDIHKVAVATLNRIGCQVIDIGLAPLPTTGIMVRHVGAAGGINITASHNSLPWHGIKLLNADGEFIDSTTLNQVTDAFSDINSGPDLNNLPLPTVATDASNDAMPTHLDYYAPADLGLRIAIDCVNGSGSVILPDLVKKLGSEPILLACDPAKPSPHEFEPTPTNLEWASQQVLRHHDVDFGIAVDPDADRLVIITGDGQVISEEYTLVLAAWHMLESGYLGPIVTNLSTSSMIDDLAARYDRDVYRSPVGEQNVVAMMKGHQAVIGGEGNGGVIDGTRHYSRDSLSALYHVAQLVATIGKTITELINELPQRYLAKYKLDRDDTMDISAIYDRINDLIASKYNVAKVNTTNGLRIDFNDQWVHVRPSNTEPIVRLFVESIDRQNADTIYQQIKCVLARD